jgi:hypothetical protein
MTRAPRATAPDGTHRDALPALAGEGRKCVAIKAEPRSPEDERAGQTSEAAAFTSEALLITWSTMR